MKEILGNLLRAAWRLDAKKGGMASVEIKYHPYETTWIAKASWSQGLDLVAQNEDPQVAVAALIAKLEEAARIRHAEAAKERE